MLFNYQEFLDGIDREAYHAGEWRWEEDGYTVTRTYTYSAPGCHTSCGVLMYTKNGKLEKIEGDPLDPCANGRLCMRCLNLEEGVNYADRPKWPLKRVGARGENKWERISWEEALDTIAEWIRVNIDEAGFGRESIFVNHGTGRNISSWVPFLGGACLGTPNIGAIGSSGYSCYLPRTCGTAASIGDFPIVDASEGHADRYANPEWVRPDVVVIWGCEPLKSNADGYLGHWLVACMQQGTQFISIDPQLTWWGAHAAYWLPLRPATDMAIALAWLHVIMYEELEDREFVDLWCAYYDELKAYVEPFTPEWAGKICELDPELIRESARFYATAERAAIQWGLAFDTQNDSIQLCQTVSNLMSITGNIDKPGTNLLVRNGFEINPGYATAQLYCPPETFAKKLTVDVTHPGYVHFIGMADCDAVNHAFETGEPYPMKMFWSQGANAITCTGNAAPRIYQMLENVEFCVVADPYLTPTAVAFADIFLPLKTTAERDSMRVWWTPLRAMKSVSEWYEAKSDEELIVALGNKMNPELFQKRWPTLDALLQDYLDTGFNIVDPETGKSYKSAGRSKAGMVEVPDAHTDFWKKHHADGTCSFQSLVEDKCCYEYDDFCATYYKYEKGMLRADGTPGFATPSGRIELVPFATFGAWGIDPWPKHHESIHSVKWLEDPEFRAEYPFICVNGSRSYEFFHSENRQQATMREFHPDPIVKVSAQTAEEYDIHEGDWIWLENSEGRCRQKAHIDPTLNPNYVYAEHGWWYPEQEPAFPNLFGMWDVNINNLTASYETGPGGIGCPFKSIVCKIYKCAPDNMAPTPGEVVTQQGGFRNDYVAGEPYAYGQEDSWQERMKRGVEA
ncbi:molybdopterin-dependent oxidoreductase [Enterorhabdus sp. P55]|uniref:molybdopterin-dependent oxidoreductase n=1 Tax=Enterorhabdus sp. P55 TaxID=2304571 RepID=UPI00136EBC0A|nr:molybdopterin-dependent oxidoreductase [Enterorhabdus sp. P55]NBI31753.1 dehydrogenase [Enterorhabdus sp. P55]